MIRFISDLHFFDNDIMKSDQLPFKSVEEMNEYIIKKWNTATNILDTVYVLGDVVAEGYEHELKSIMKRLNGNKILIVGNHDSHRTNEFWREVGFSEVYRTDAVIIDKWIVLSHKPPEYMTDNLPWVWFYGHVHNTEMYKTITSSTACVCAARWDFRPVSKQRLLELIKSEREREKNESNITCEYKTIQEFSADKWEQIKELVGSNSCFLAEMPYGVVELKSAEQAKYFIKHKCDACTYKQFGSCSKELATKCTNEINKILKHYEGA